MTAKEALELALEKESASIKLYERLAAEHPAIKDLLIDLLNQEYLHKKIIEERIAKMRSA